MAFQVIIGKHFDKEHYTAIDAYFIANQLVLEKEDGKSFVRKISDPQGHKRFILRSIRDRYDEHLADVFRMYVGKVVDPNDVNLEEELKRVEQDLPGAQVHYW